MTVAVLCRKGLKQEADMNIPSGFGFIVSLIIIVILVSIQYTLNMILKELKSLRNSVVWGDRYRDPDRKDSI